MTGAGFLRDLSPQIEMFVRPWLADLVSHQNFTSANRIAPSEFLHARHIERKVELDLSIKESCFRGLLHLRGEEDEVAFLL